MSININQQRCKRCPEVEKIKRSAIARLDKSQLAYELNLLEVSICEGATCWILKYFNSPAECPCTICLLKVCCSEDCAEKIKALRKSQELIKQENTEARQWGLIGTNSLTKGTKIKNSTTEKSMEEIQESLRVRNAQYEKETQKYKKRRK